MLHYLMYFELQVIDDGLHHRALSSDVGGGYLKGGDAIVPLCMDMLKTKGLQLASGKLQWIEAGVNGGILGNVVAVEVSELAFPLQIVVIKAAPELLLGLLNLL